MNYYQIKSSFRIGKNGIKESLIKDISFQLKKKGVIKIKILKNFINQINDSNDIKDYKQKLAELIADKTHSVVLKIIGNSIILKYKY